MKRLSLVARIWLGAMFVATVGAVAWVLYISALAGVAVYDFNPEALQRLSESEREGIVGTAKMLTLSSATPPLVVSAAWAITAIVALRRRRDAL